MVRPIEEKESIQAHRPKRITSAYSSNPPSDM